MGRETCISCGGEMIHMGQEKLQMGKYSLLMGAWSHLMSGALAVDLFCCANCKKLEFYAVASPEKETDAMAQIPCPHCGELHEMDDVKCPHCGERLY